MTAEVVGVTHEAQAKPEPGPRARHISRRSFLAAAAGAGASVAVTTAAGPLVGIVRGAEARLAPDASQPLASTRVEPAGRPVLVPFEGRHQAGIDRPAISQAASLFAAFDVVAADRAELRELFGELTRRARDLAQARVPVGADDRYPPPESGILGSAIGPSDLTTTLSVGASLFDERYGLAPRRPRQLVTMPTFANDQLAPDGSHGDLAVQVCATDAPACIHALRYLMLGTRASMSLRWMVEGFQRPNTQPGHDRTTTRNLLGFKDGTANLVVGSPELEQQVWVTERDGEPDWAVDGSYLAVRTIRMFVERWDRTALDEQEHIIGRVKRTGAPLGQGREEETPDYATDPSGERIPLDAHIRLANPRTPGSERNRILRRGYSFSRGFDAAGQLDQGLLFIAYQRDLASGFMAVQGRLDGEALEEYIRPVGGGFFFTLPGVSGEGRYLGDGLLG